MSNLTSSGHNEVKRERAYCSIITFTSPAIVTMVYGQSVWERYKWVARMALMYTVKR